MTHELQAGEWDVSAFASPHLRRRRRPQRMSLALRVLLYMLRGLRIGELEVVLPTGERRRFHGSEAGPRGVLVIHDARLVRHVLLNGEVGFGEAYLDGCWDSPDLSSLLEVMYLNEPHYLGPYEKNWLARAHGRWQHRRRHNSVPRARDNIAQHYDLGNEFYKLWLDDSLTYSSAVFDDAPNATLADAQQEKFRRLQERLRLEPQHHVLEIGSGWGAFAIDTARRYGCRVTSITLSQAQLEEARARAAEAGVADRVHFELQDYRDVTARFDRVVSVEMYEAVGREYWDAYFASIQRALRPGGIAVLQGITIDETIFEPYLQRRDFIQKHVFPGGMLAPVARLIAHARGAGLEVDSPQMFGQSYARTLALWHRNVLAQRDAIVHHYGERFLRLWRYYLSYCECGFRARKIDLLQVTFTRG